LRSVLRENDIPPESILKIAFCTVVPHLTYSLTSACLKYFKIEPYFLGPGSKTGLKICYQNPVEVGADRIANAIAAEDLFPKTNKLIIDTGTATTICAVNSNKEYLGGIILPGMKIGMVALEKNTAKLPSVEILERPTIIGRSTVASIQSGLYYSHFYGLQGMINHIKQEQFKDEKVKVIGTGGFAHLFNEEKIFDLIIQDLVLKGLLISAKVSS
jgi:type III pantothenate kinase